MPDSVTRTRLETLENYAFDHFLRTGRRAAIDALEAAVEAKINPYHDPDNGRFTTREGRWAGLQSLPRPAAIRT